MAETGFVTAVLAAVLAVHLFGVGTSVFAESVPCSERCNLGHGDCDSSGKCRCQPGWEGENCNRCTRALGCMHGTCHQPWQCNCKPGWAGPRCDKDLQICERTQPCLNQATCINNGNGEYLCHCQPGFYGRRCENYLPGGLPDSKPTTEPPTTTTTTTTKAPKYCQHGGKCRIYSLDGGCERCMCHPGYVGRHCETNVNECLMLPCTNGGRCFDLTNDFYCECQRGYTGRRCEDDVDECSLTPDMCYNGGQCENTFGSYECTCQEGFTGKRCADVDPMVARKPFIPRIVRIASTTQAGTEKSETTTAETLKKPNIVKNPDVKVTKITHELKISADGGSSNSEVVIRSQVDGNSEGSSALQTLTFVFMGLAIVILGAIFVLVWFRCFRKQSEGTKKRKQTTNLEAANSTSSVSSVDEEIRDNRRSAAVVTVDTDSIDELDESVMQVQPCLPNRRNATTYPEPVRTRDPCPSPPPPYTLSAVDARRSQSHTRPGYYVALPPSHQELSQARKSSNTTYQTVSNEPEETSSLLEADSPTMSHKIVV